ncbi:hypothetical protein ACOSQ2_028536 [Xanthoceras sorbifolium]
MTSLFSYELRKQLANKVSNLSQIHGVIKFDTNAKVVGFLSPSKTQDQALLNYHNILTKLLLLPFPRVSRLPACHITSSSKIFYIPLWEKKLVLKHEITLKDEFYNDICKCSFKRVPGYIKGKPKQS